ncbi:uncharacterized protein NECHADRAFT_89442 [Fusarium vanettenii 77-13-4]|uniref:Uncharacterized protein n=1 Tax=Fusarium vanettenii (strain ATCC MYA-4622 / CBS 123669 / FGSC 9596 / NRRL 45880 / 77-13-4) TaxID=660122 RepID=C7ZR79_FUSV7|nr:uncharacterized protein NECHADRAFT_89442 [Fusarium vanettenii 77-13-4]EEU33475.1 predicted protein [Fusarium vanettenii 77-13-4]
MATLAIDDDSTRTEERIGTPTADIGGSNVEGDNSDVTDDNTPAFDDLFDNDNANPGRKDIDISSSDDDSDYESDLEEIEPVRPRKFGDSTGRSEDPPRRRSGPERTPSSASTSNSSCAARSTPQESSPTLIAPGPMATIRKSSELDEEMADDDTLVAGNGKIATPVTGKGKETTGTKRDKTKGKSNMIGGRPATGVSGKQARVDDNISVVAANAAATSIAISKEVDEIKANVNKLRDQLVNKAIRITACEATKDAVDEYNKNLKEFNAQMEKIVVAEVAKPAKKRAPGPAKSTGKTGASNGDEIGWDQNFFDDE